MRPKVEFHLDISQLSGSAIADDDESPEEEHNNLTFYLTALHRGDQNRRRRPPPPATPLDFPCCEPQLQHPCQPPNDETDGKSLLDSFSSIGRKGPSQDHLRALNTQVDGSLNLEDLVPQGYLPPSSWAESEEGDDEFRPKSTLLSNGLPFPQRKEFYVRVREFAFANEDVERVVNRLPPLYNDQPRPRLQYTRQFWVELDLMRNYWDTSQDEYFNESDDSTDASAMDIDQLRAEAQRTEQRGDGKRSKQTADKSNTTEQASTSAAAAAEDKTTYTGRRTDTGKNMPAEYREKCVFAFVDILAQPFRSRVHHTSVQPRLHLQGTLLQMPHMGFVHREPIQTTRPQNFNAPKIVHGPVLAVSTCLVGDTVSFRKPDEATGEGKVEIMHLMKEIGVTLFTAQKRLMGGVIDKSASEDQWWMTAKRWGGGTGLAVGRPISDGSKTKVEKKEEKKVEEKEEKKLGKAEEQSEKKTAPSKVITTDGRKRAKTNLNHPSLQMPRSYRPPTSSWERNIEYGPIGMMKGAEYDDVSTADSLPSCCRRPITLWVLRNVSGRSFNC